MAKKRKRERDLYPLVEKWMKRRFNCFTTAIDKGLKLTRIDVLGVRDVGGDLEGNVEVIAIEVKRGNVTYTQAAGQTIGYRVFANRVFLAVERKEKYNQDEVHIANDLGIGLIRIHNNRCFEEKSSPYYEPLSRFRLSLLEAVRLGECRICGNIFSTGTRQSPSAHLTKSNLGSAFENERGLEFWNKEVAARKKRIGLRVAPGLSHDKRYICPECVATFFVQ